MTGTGDMIIEAVTQEGKEEDLDPLEMRKEEGGGQDQEQETMTTGACHSFPSHPSQDPLCPPLHLLLLLDMMVAGPVRPVAAAAV